MVSAQIYPSQSNNNMLWFLVWMNRSADTPSMDTLWLGMAKAPYQEFLLDTPWFTWTNMDL